MARRLVRLWLVCVFAVACGDGADDPGVEGCPSRPTEGGFRLVVNPERLDLHRGESTTLQIWALDRDECAAEVEVSLRGLPPGVISSHKTIAWDRTSTHLEIQVAADAERIATEIEIDARSPSSFRTHRMPFSVLAAGRHVEAFGEAGVARVQDEARLIDVALDREGRVYLLLREDGSQVKLRRLTGGGSIDDEFGSLLLPLERSSYRPGALLRIDDERSRLYVAGKRGTGTVIHAIHTSGTVDRNFGTGGELVLDSANQPLDMRVHPNGLRIGGVGGFNFFHLATDPAGETVSTTSGAHEGGSFQVGAVHAEGLVLGRDKRIWDADLRTEIPQAEFFWHPVGGGKRGYSSTAHMEHERLQPGPSGEIYACGGLVLSTNPYYVTPMIQKWWTDGTLDKAYGGSGTGYAETARLGFNTCRDVAPLPSGIVMLMDGGSLARFDANGKRDPRFGENGLVTLPDRSLPVMAHDEAAGIVLAQQGDGLLVITRLHP